MRVAQLWALALHPLAASGSGNEHGDALPPAVALQTQSPEAPLQLTVTHLVWKEAVLTSPGTRGGRVGVLGNSWGRGRRPCRKAGPRAELWTSPGRLWRSSRSGSPLLQQPSFHSPLFREASGLSLAPFSLKGAGSVTQLSSLERNLEPFQRITEWLGLQLMLKIFYSLPPPAMGRDATH